MNILRIFHKEYLKEYALARWHTNTIYDIYKD